MNTEDGFILSSITYAMRAKQTLFGYDIKCYVQRLPAAVTGCGCGYGLRLAAPQQMQQARQHIEAAGIAVKGTYCSHDLP
ncbi:MAG: DUF3343 domain-containing protein [Clostridia bacterium]|nr:DUF3343 domain-containing protein [Clostridia bacterium]